MAEVPEESSINPAEFTQQVAAALAQIRPALQADGGDIELMEVKGIDARVRLVGACHG